MFSVSRSSRRASALTPRLPISSIRPSSTLSSSKKPAATVPSTAAARGQRSLAGSSSVPYEIPTDSSVSSSSPYIPSRQTVSRSSRVDIRPTSLLLPRSNPNSIFSPLDIHPPRHLGPDATETEKMLSVLGYSSMDDFIADAVPASIRVAESTVDDVSIPPLSDSEFSLRAKEIADKNEVFKSYIGMGYHQAVVPGVILRNVGPSFGLGRFLPLFRLKSTQVVDIRVLELDPFRSPRTPPGTRLTRPTSRRSPRVGSRV
jgi:hypothetical protein